MKKITKNDYWKFKKDFETAVANGALPGRKDQKQSKKRAVYYAKWAKKMNLHIETVRRAARSKNYQEYLRLGRENRGTSTKRKTTYIGSVPSVFTYQPEPKPKKYKTTIIATEAVIPDDWIIKDTIKAGHLISYTVEVL